MTSKADVGRAADILRVAIFAVINNFKAPISLASRLTWVGSELERLAGEAYRLADEAGEDSEAVPTSDPCAHPIPGFDPEGTP